MTRAWRWAFLAVVVAILAINLLSFSVARRWRPIAEEAIVAAQDAMAVARTWQNLALDCRRGGAPAAPADAPQLMYHDPCTAQDVPLDGARIHVDTGCVERPVDRP